MAGRALYSTSRKPGRFGWLYVLFVSHVHASFTISPEGATLQQCLATNLTWTEEPPIHLWAAPNADDEPGDATLHDFGIINNTFTLWTVDLPVGQNVSFTYVRTANPYNLLSSSQYIVVAGHTDSCLPGHSSSGTPSASSTAVSSSSSTTLRSTSSSSSASATSKADGNISTKNLTWVAGLVTGLAIVIIGAIAAFFVVRCRRRRLGKRSRLLVGTLLHNEISQSSGEGSAELESGEPLSSNAQASGERFIITPFAPGLDRSLSTSHDRDNALQDRAFERYRPNETSEINTSMTLTYCDTDAGITFADDGVPDILPPEYEDRRQTTSI